jgi:integrase
MIGLAERYLLGRDVSAGHAGNIRRVAARMNDAGITPDNIEGQRVTTWLSSLRATLSARSVSSERNLDLTLWKYGFEEGLVKNPVRGVQKIKVPRRVTRAFTRNQCTAAVKQISSSDFGKFRKSGCPKSLWLEAWYRTAYETGIRFTDIYNLKHDSVVDGGIAIVASKTNGVVIKRITAETQALLDRLLEMSPDGSIFSWAVSRRWAFANIKAAFKAIGLDAGRTQWLRRSGATHAEIAQPGSAARFLCHATPGLAERHYLDHTQLLGQAPAPPPLE